MEYLLSFLEGIISFISPCLLPMLPIYVSYFAGQNTEGKRRRALVNSIGFVLGFSVIFVVLGAFAGTVGNFLRQYQVAVNITMGAILILFGLNYMGLIKIPFLNASRQMNINTKDLAFFQSVLFGAIFSIGWTPCVGAFLGSALMLAAQTGSSFKGILLLLSFSLGLGIPFIASAVLIDRLKSTFDFIKRHYTVIINISGALLILMGILMATGTLGAFLSILSF